MKKNEFISFAIDRIESPIVIDLTDNVVNKLDKKLWDRDNTQYFLWRLSCRRIINIVPGIDKKSFFISTEKGNIHCTIRYDDSGECTILAEGYSECSCRTQSMTGKYGLSVSIDGEYALSFRYKKDYENTFCIYSKTFTGDPEILYDEYYKNDLDKHNVQLNSVLSKLDASSAADELISLFSKAKVCSEEEMEAEGNSMEDTVKVEEAFDDLLILAENYAMLSAEMERKKAQESGPVSYVARRGTEKDTVDRRSLELELNNPLDESVYTEGQQIEFDEMENNDTPVQGEITALIREEEGAPVTAVRVLLNKQTDMTKIPKSGTFIIAYNNVSERVQLEAIEKLRTNTAAAKYLNDVFGKKSFNPLSKISDFDILERLEKANEGDADSEKKLEMANDSQLDAICGGVRSGDIYLVMGPPGTGKTTVIIQWVKYFVSQNMRVLISSQNNKAVDNVLERFNKGGKKTDIIRIGSETKIQDNVRQYMFEKRIEELRTSIQNHSDNHISNLTELIEKWKDFKKNLKTYYTAREKQDAAEARLSEFVTERVLPAHQECSRLYASYSARMEAADSLFNRFNDDEMKYERINLPWDTRVRLLSQIKTKMDYYDMTAAAEAAKFNAAFERRRECLDAAREIYLEYASECRKVNRALRKLTIPKPEGKTVGNLFKSCSEYTRKYFCEHPESIEVIDQELNRSQEIVGTVENWNMEMSSTQNYSLTEILLESVDVVGATCIGINSQKRFSGLNFDVTIIDEAGQIQLHNALVPMSVSNKLIMLGDHMQIPPSKDPELFDLCDQNNVSTDYLSASLFEKMYIDSEITEPEHKTMLNTQFRMPSQIADIISDEFYGGRYLSGENKMHVDSLLPTLSKFPFVIIDTSAEKNRHESKSQGETGCRNELEAKIAAAVVREAMSKRSRFSSDKKHKHEEIGVISAYKLQVKLLRKELREMFGDDAVMNAAAIDGMVASLDSFQGQERELIIYSFTKSSKISPQKQRIGFLKELRRLNVAMTRPTKTLVMIGDMDFLSSCRADNSDTDSYDTSERHFSAFISDMLSKVSNESHPLGEIISCEEFKKRLGELP